MDAKSETRRAVFRPDVYEVKTLEQAMSVTVTPERGTTTAERWEKETPYLVSDITKRLEISSDSYVLDYGCGTGRIAKPLIESLNCRVIGVDASQSMRLLAPEYVLSERFSVWSPEALTKMIAAGFRFDQAYSLWVIQHVLDAKAVINTIHDALKPGGLFYCLNGGQRCVPTDLGYVNDGFDMKAGLQEAFDEQSFHSLPGEVTTPDLARRSMIQVLRK